MYESMKELVDDVEVVLVWIGIYIIQNDGSTDVGKVMEFIVFEALVERVILQSAGCIVSSSTNGSRTNMDGLIIYVDK